MVIGINASTRHTVKASLVALHKAYPPVPPQLSENLLAWVDESWRTPDESTTPAKFEMLMASLTISVVRGVIVTVIVFEMPALGEL